MSLLCRLGLHSWETTPYMRSGLSGNLAYRRCRRCQKKEEIYEARYALLTLTKEVDEIPECFWTGIDLTEEVREKRKELSR